MSDYPEKTSTVLFCIGCNFRCPYCYNSSLFNERKRGIHSSLLLDVLQNRYKFSKFVVVSGGEPTIQEKLPDFLKTLKERGFIVKLDTNGSNPEMILKCLPYLDYIAMDVKTSPSHYQMMLKNFNAIEIWKSINIIKKGGIDYEFRTVACPPLVNNTTIKGIFELVKNSKRYRITQFNPSECYVKWYRKVKPYPKETLNILADVVSQNGIEEIYVEEEKYEA